ncbi:muscle M-line assembly protein unc-89-like [Lineus longissimus]|uniref:muscle M-line assembly protein unc-89-like n=1 Tax=Lineus longissimus TaxID=88925 RepID=UPI00315CA83F
MAAYRRSSSLSKWDELLALREKLKLDQTADLEKDKANDDSAESGSQAHSMARGGTSTSRSEDSRDRDKNSDSTSNSTWGKSGGNHSFRMAGIAEQIMTGRNIDPKKWESMSKPQKLRIIASERRREAEEVNNQQRDISELKRRLHKKKNAKRVFNLADMIKVQRQMDNHADIVPRPTNVGLDSGYTSPSTGSPLVNSDPQVEEAAKNEEARRTLHHWNSRGAAVKTLSFEETRRERQQAGSREVDVPGRDPRTNRQEITEERTVASKWQRQVVSKEGTGIGEGGASKGNRNEFVVKADVIVSATGASGDTVINSQQGRSGNTSVSLEKNRSDTKLVKTEINSRVDENSVHSAETSKSVIANTNTGNEIVPESKVKKDNRTVGESEVGKEGRQKCDESEKTADSRSSKKVEKTAENKGGEKVEKSTSKLLGSVVKKGSKMADREDNEKDPQEKKEKEPEKESEKESEKKEEEKPKTPEKEEEKGKEANELEKERTPSPELEREATPAAENDPEPEKSPSSEPKKEAETAPPKPNEEQKKEESPSEGEKEPKPTEEAPVVETGPQEGVDTLETEGDDDSEEDDEEAQELQTKKERQDKIDSTLSALDALIDNQLNSVLGRPQTSDNGPVIPKEKLDELLNGEFSQALDRYLQGKSDGTDLMDKCLEVLG